jgi:hypothetical protein
MRVRITNEHYLGDLIAFLERADYRVAQVGDREIIVAPVPRSKRLEVLQLDLELQLRAWEAAHPEASVVVGGSGS